MDSPSIDFFSEDVDFTLPKADAVTSWINLVASSHGCKVENLSYIFVSDENLLEMNRQHLNHDFYTDILTFPFHEPGTKWLMGDVFISIDRVRENADEMGIAFPDELHRVIIHGLLHLVGFDDQTVEGEAQMRKLEDTALLLRKF